jgi:hypothetical protein
MDDNISPNEKSYYPANEFENERTKEMLLKWREEMGEDAFYQHPASKVLDGLLHPEKTAAEIRARLRKVRTQRHRG